MTAGTPGSSPRQRLTPTQGIMYRCPGQSTTTPPNYSSYSVPTQPQTFRPWSSEMGCPGNDVKQTSPHQYHANPMATHVGHQHSEMLRQSRTPDVNTNGAANTPQNPPAASCETVHHSRDQFMGITTTACNAPSGYKEGTYNIPHGPVPVQPNLPQPGLRMDTGASGGPVAGFPVPSGYSAMQATTPQFGSLYQCAHCGHTTKSEQTVKEHIRMEHWTKSESFVCKECLFITPKAPEYSSHVSTLHPGEDPWSFLPRLILDALYTRSITVKYYNIKDDVVRPKSEVLPAALVDGIGSNPRPSRKPRPKLQDPGANGNLSAKSMDSSPTMVNSFVKSLHDGKTWQVGESKSGYSDINTCHSNGFHLGDPVGVSSDMSVQKPDMYGPAMVHDTELSLQDPGYPGEKAHSLIPEHNDNSVDTRDILAQAMLCIDNPDPDDKMILADGGIQELYVAPERDISATCAIIAADQGTEVAPAAVEPTEHNVANSIPVQTPSSCETSPLCNNDGALLGPSPESSEPGRDKAENHDSGHSTHSPTSDCYQDISDECLSENAEVTESHHPTHANLSSPGDMCCRSCARASPKTAKVEEGVQYICPHNVKSVTLAVSPEKCPPVVQPWPEQSLEASKESTPEQTTSPTKSSGFQAEFLKFADELVNEDMDHISASAASPSSSVVSNDNCLSTNGDGRNHLDNDKRRSVCSPMDTEKVSGESPMGIESILPDPEANTTIGLADDTDRQCSAPNDSGVVVHEEETIEMQLPSPAENKVFGMCKDDLNVESSETDGQPDIMDSGSESRLISDHEDIGLDNPVPQWKSGNSSPLLSDYCDNAESAYDNPQYDTHEERECPLSPGMKELDEMGSEERDEEQQNTGELSEVDENDVSLPHSLRVACESKSESACDRSYPDDPQEINKAHSNCSSDNEFTHEMGLQEADFSAATTTESETLQEGSGTECDLGVSDTERPTKALSSDYHHEEHNTREHANETMELTRKDVYAKGIPHPVTESGGCVTADCEGNGKDEIEVSTQKNETEPHYTDGEEDFSAQETENEIRKADDVAAVCTERDETGHQHSQHVDDVVYDFTTDTKNLAIEPQAIDEGDGVRATFDEADICRASSPENIPSTFDEEDICPASAPENIPSTFEENFRDEQANQLSDAIVPLDLTVGSSKHPINDQEDVTASGGLECESTPEDENHSNTDETAEQQPVISNTLKSQSDPEGYQSRLETSDPDSASDEYMHHREHVPDEHHILGDQEAELSGSGFSRADTDFQAVTDESAVMQDQHIENDMSGRESPCLDVEVQDERHQYDLPHLESLSDGDAKGEMSPPQLDACREVVETELTKVDQNVYSDVEAAKHQVELCADIQEGKQDAPKVAHDSQEDADGALYPLINTHLEETVKGMDLPGEKMVSQEETMQAEFPEEQPDIQKETNDADFPHDKPSSHEEVLYPEKEYGSDEEQNDFPLDKLDSLEDCPEVEDQSPVSIDVGEPEISHHLGTTVAEQGEEMEDDQPLPSCPGLDVETREERNISAVDDNCVPSPRLCAEYETITPEHSDEEDMAETKPIDVRELSRSVIRDSDEPSVSPTKDSENKNSETACMPTAMVLNISGKSMEQDKCPDRDLSPPHSQPPEEDPNPESSVNNDCSTIDSHTSAGDIGQEKGENLPPKDQDGLATKGSGLCIAKDKKSAKSKAEKDRRSDSKFGGGGSNKLRLTQRESDAKRMSRKRKLSRESKQTIRRTGKKETKSDQQERQQETSVGTRLCIRPRFSKLEISKKQKLTVTHKKAGVKRKSTSCEDVPKRKCRKRESQHPHIKKQEPTIAESPQSDIDILPSLDKAAQSDGTDKESFMSATDMDDGNGNLLFKIEHVCSLAEDAKEHQNAVSASEMVAAERSAPVTAQTGTDDELPGSQGGIVASDDNVAVNFHRDLDTSQPPPPVKQHPSVNTEFSDVSDDEAGDFMQQEGFRPIAWSPTTITESGENVADEGHATCSGASNECMEEMDVATCSNNIAAPAEGMMSTEEDMPAGTDVSEETGQDALLEYTQEIPETEIADDAADIRLDPQLMDANSTDELPPGDCDISFGNEVPVGCEVEIGSDSSPQHLSTQLGKEANQVEIVACNEEVFEVPTEEVDYSNPEINGIQETHVFRDADPSGCDIDTTQYHEDTDDIGQSAEEPTKEPVQSERSVNEMPSRASTKGQEHWTASETPPSSSDGKANKECSKKDGSPRQERLVLKFTKSATGQNSVSFDSQRADPVPHGAGVAAEWECLLCPYRSMNKLEVKRHIGYKHLLFKIFSCSACARHSDSHQSVVQHIRKVHRGVRVFVKTNPWLEQLMDHVKELLCLRSGSDLRWKAMKNKLMELARHHMYISDRIDLADQSKYECLLCSKMMRSQALISKHVTEHVDESWLASAVQQGDRVRGGTLLDVLSNLYVPTAASLVCKRLKLSGAAHLKDILKPDVSRLSFLTDVTEDWDSCDTHSSREGDTSQDSCDNNNTLTDSYNKGSSRQGALDVLKTLIDKGSSRRSEKEQKLQPSASPIYSSPSSKIIQKCLHPTVQAPSSKKGRHDAAHGLSHGDSSNTDVRMSTVLKRISTLETGEKRKKVVNRRYSDYETSRLPERKEAKAGAKQTTKVKEKLPETGDKLQNLKPGKAKRSPIKVSLFKRGERRKSDAVEPVQGYCVSREVVHYSSVALPAANGKRRSGGPRVKRSLREIEDSVGYHVFRIANRGQFMHDLQLSILTPIVILDKTPVAPQ